jgi:YfiH family protein
MWLHQVHGTKVVSLDNHSSVGVEADGSFTTAPHTACVVRVADCLPILLCNAQGTWVAALHAGWRGLAGNQGIGVVEQARRAYGASDLIAWLGPCIGKTVFEVGDEVRLAFTAHQPETQPFFTPVIHAEESSAKKWMADLAGLARWRLQAAGIPNHAIFGNDGSRAWCTVSNPDQFFSYRREKECGRMAAAIWMNH